MARSPAARESLAFAQALKCARFFQHADLLPKKKIHPQPCRHEYLQREDSHRQQDAHDSRLTGHERQNDDHWNNTPDEVVAVNDQAQLRDFRPKANSPLENVAQTNWLPGSCICTRDLNPGDKDRPEREQESGSDSCGSERDGRSRFGLGEMEKGKQMRNRGWDRDDECEDKKREPSFSVNAKSFADDLRKRAWAKI